MEERLSSEQRWAIRSIGFHDLRARHVSSRHQVDLHLQSAAGMTLKRTHSHLSQASIGCPERLLLVHLEPKDRVRPDRVGDTDPVSISDDSDEG